MKKYLIYIFLILTAVSCGSRKSITPTPTGIGQPMEDTSAFFADIENPVQFDALKISSRIKISNGKLIPTLNATFYIEKDKKVWTNITAFMGLFGGARGIATPQGIKAYEKINKTYIDSDFSYLNNLLGVNFINFQALQNLLVGKTFVPINPKKYEVQEFPDKIQVTSKNPQKVKVDGKESSYHITLNYDKEYKLSNVQINDVHSPNELKIEYSNYIKLQNEYFPQNVKVNIKNKKDDEIFIENTNFEFSQMETPYSVPANYKKTVIK